MIGCTFGMSGSSDASLRGVVSSSGACSSDTADSSVSWTWDIANVSLAGDSDVVEGSPGGAGVAGNVPGM